jgi:oxaloacetate decarboxylase alpha subunit
LEKWQVPQPTLAEMRRKYGGANLPDEELLLRFFAGPNFVDALKAAPPRKEYLDARQPLVKLVEELGRKRQLHQVHIQKGDMTISIARHNSATPATFVRRVS